MRPSPPSPPSHRPPVRRERGGAAAGYNLVMLMVLLAVLNIAIAISLPAWSGVIRRDREEELIFRGFQYAEAIRVFQNRFQRPPIRLQELVEVEPRSIRQLWKDPMTDKNDWVLIPLQGPQQGGLTPQIPGQDPQGGPQEPGEGGEEGEDGQDDGSSGPGSVPKQIQVGPFKGVHSRSNKTSFLVFNGRDRYDEWHFTVDLLINPAAQGQTPQAQGPGGDPSRPAGGGLQLSTRWIGRPLPEFLMPPQGNGLPQDDNVDRETPDDDSEDDEKGRPRGTGKP